MNRGIAISLLLVPMIVGCAGQTHAPLVFVSTNSLGVDIGADPAAAQTPRLTLGYKSNDVALVPITTENKSGSPIRGCYHAGINMNQVPTCADVVNGQQNEDMKLPGKPESPARARGANATHVPAEQDSILSLQRVAQAMDAKPLAAPIEIQQGVTQRMAAAPTGEPGQKALPANPGVNAFGQSMRDSLSVFSSFNADARVGAAGGVQLGKAFATGVAAQQLSEGINYYMQQKGRSLASGMTSESNKELMLRNECLQSLIAAKDKKVPDDKLPNCAEKGQQTADELKAKAVCVDSLAAAKTKGVADDKLPKCS